MKDLLSRILDHYGVYHQTNKLREELAELQLALARMHIHGELINVEQVAEEIADVENMLDQFKMAFNLEDQVKLTRFEKAKREQRRIDAKERGYEDS